MEKEHENFNETYDKAQKMQMEKYRNESYFMKCERDQLKLQLKELNTIKEKYDLTTEQIQKKYEKSKSKIKEYLNQNEFLEKTNIELREKLHNELEIVKEKLIFTHYFLAFKINCFYCFFIYENLFFRIMKMTKD